MQRTNYKSVFASAIARKRKLNIITTTNMFTSASSSKYELSWSRLESAGSSSVSARTRLNMAALFHDSGLPIPCPS